MPLRRGRTEFFEAGGEVHPIRNSPGYSKEVEDVSREQKHHESRERFYRGVKREKSGVDRPPWAGNLNDTQLRQIAKRHGQSPEREGWWEKAGLWKGTGELRYAKEEGHLQEQRGRPKPAAHGLRRGGRVERYKKAADLPF
jgi:hypothetical protein